MPGDAKVSLPGSDLASAMNSCIVFTGSVGLTTNTLGTDITLVIGWKSFTGS